MRSPPALTLAAAALADRPPPRTPAYAEHATLLPPGDLAADDAAVAPRRCEGASPRPATR